MNNENNNINNNETVEILPVGNSSVNINEPVNPIEPKVQENEVSVNASKPVINIESNSKQDENNKVVSQGFENVNNNFYGKERKIWPFVFLIIILAIVGFGCYYYFVMTKPVNVIKKLFNNSYENVSKHIKEYNKDDTKTISGNTNITLSSSNENLKDLNGLNVKLDFGNDLTNKNKNYANVNVSLSKQELVNLKLALIDKKIYLNLKDSINKVVYSEMSIEESTTDLGDYLDKNKINETINEEMYLLKVVKDALINNISEEKLSKKMLMKKVDSKRVPAIEVKYHIDYNEYKKLYKAIIDAIVNDTKTINFLTNISGESQYKIKDDLIKTKDEISELDFENDVDIELTIDAITNKFIELKITEKDEYLLAIDKGNELDVELVTNDGNISITVDKKENKFFIDFKMLDEARLSITGKIDKNTDTEGSVTFSVIVYDPADINKEMGNISGEINLVLNKNIETFDITDAVNMDDLSEKDQEEVANALLPLIQLLGMEEVEEVSVKNF